MIVADLDTQQMPDDTFETFHREVFEFDDALYERHEAIVVFLSRTRPTKKKGAGTPTIVTRTLVKKPEGWDLMSGYLWDAEAVFAVGDALAGPPHESSGVATVDALTVASTHWNETEKRYVKHGKDKWFVAHTFTIAKPPETRIVIREMKRQKGGWNVVSSLDVPESAAKAWGEAVVRARAKAPA